MKKTKLMLLGIAAVILISFTGKDKTTNKEEKLDLKKVEKSLAKVSDKLYACKYEATNQEYYLLLRNKKDSLNNKKFNRFIEKGDSELLKDKNKEAIEYYNKANELMPTNKSVSERIKILNCYDPYKSEYNDDKLYVCLIACADKFFSESEYKIARLAYIKAGLVKKETYPLERVKQIDKLLNTGKGK